MSERRQVNSEKDPRVGCADQLASDELSKRVEERRSRFVTAARVAQEVHDQREATTGLRLNWAGGLAAVLLAVAALIVGVLTWPESATPPLIDVAEADEFLGVRGVVISSHDRSPVPGVIIKEHLADDVDSSGDFVAITDAMGLFEIRPEEAGERLLTFIHSGREVGQIRVGRGNGVSGYINVPVDVALERGCQRYPLELAPGKTCEPYSGMRVSLSAGADEPWSGELVHELGWPANFTFGKVLAGVFTLDGPAAKGLRLEFSLDPLIPEVYEFDPQELKLVSYSERYEKEDDRWRALHHQGWYAANLLYDEQVSQFGLQRLALDVNYELPRGVGKCGRFSATWDATPGQEYALLTPVLTDGRIVACVFDRIINGEHVQEPYLCLINGKWAHPWLYLPTYIPPGHTQQLVKGGPMQRGMPKYPLWGEWSVDQTPTGKNAVKPLLGRYELAPLPGQLACYRHDFTLTNPVEYGIDASKLNRPEHTIDVENGLVTLGALVELQVTADTPNPNHPYAWDFFADGTLDTEGDSGSMLISQYGIFPFRCVFEDDTGLIMVVERTLGCLPVGALGSYASGTSTLPVVAASIDPIPTESARRIFSRFAVSNPQSFGMSVSDKTGPWVYVQPPAEWGSTPLAEMRIYLTIRSATKSAEEIALTARVIAVRQKLTDRNPDPTSQFKVLIDFPTCLGNGRMDVSAQAWLICSISESLNADNNSASASELLYSAVKLNDINRQKYKEILGIDLYDLSSDAELHRVIDDYACSPYCSMIYAKQITEQHETVVDLRGAVLREDEGFLVNHHIEDMNQAVAGQWEVFIGGDDPSRIEIKAVDSRTYTAYLAY